MDVTNNVNDICYNHMLGYCSGKRCNRAHAAKADVTETFALQICQMITWSRMDAAKRTLCTRQRSKARWWKEEWNRDGRSSPETTEGWTRQSLTTLQQRRWQEMFTGGMPSIGDISKDRAEQAGEEGSDAASSDQPSSPKFSAGNTLTDSNGYRQRAGGVEQDGGAE